MGWLKELGIPIATLTLFLVSSLAVGQGLGQDSPDPAYLADRVGFSEFRDLFADWAAHTTANFGYLTRDQVARAFEEWELVADTDDAAPTVMRPRHGWLSPAFPTASAVRPARPIRST